MPRLPNAEKLDFSMSSAGGFGERRHRSWYAISW